MDNKEYSKAYNKKLVEEQKQMRKESHIKRQRVKAIHCTAEELQNVIRIVNEEFGLNNS